MELEASEDNILSTRGEREECDHLLISMATGEKEIMWFATHNFMMRPSPIYEFDEADIWNTADVSSSPSPDREFYQLATPSSTGDKKKKSMASSSLPMKIHQEWSKTLGIVGYEDSAEEELWLLPHVFLARLQRATEKTLVGRNLSTRVRDAIWKHTGFEDCASIFLSTQ